MSSLSTEVSYSTVTSSDHVALKLTVNVIAEPSVAEAAATLTSGTPSTVPTRSSLSSVPPGVQTSVWGHALNS